MKLSDDGLYYWDGARWVSALSPDGRWRWNGSAWVPLAGMLAPAYPYYQQPTTVRLPTPWTRPMQYAVAAWYAISALYTLSTPFWMSGVVGQIFTQAFQRSAAQNPNVSPPPPDVVASMTALMTGMLWVGALFGVAIYAVVIVGALKRWTWLFYVVLVFLGLGAVSLPFNLVSAVAGSTALNIYNLPTWLTWLSVGFGIPGAALFVWMLVAVIRYGPWATTKRVEWPGQTTPASGVSGN